MKNEKNKQGRKRVAMGPQGVKELTAAVEDLSKWLTEYLKGKTQYGDFSMSVLGEEPVTYFAERAVLKFFEGTWERKKNETLRKILGRIVISDMGHALRDWKKKGGAQLCSMDEEGMLRIVEEATQEWEENLLQKEIIRRIGYDIAKDKVKDDPELTKYHWGQAPAIGSTSSPSHLSPCQAPMIGPAPSPSHLSPCQAPLIGSASQLGYYSTSQLRSALWLLTTVHYLSKSRVGRLLFKTALRLRRLLQRILQTYHRARPQ